MRFFRLLMAALLLASLSPLASLLLGGFVAKFGNCQIEIDGAPPCVIWGKEIGEQLHAMSDFGFAYIATFPAFFAIVAIWLIVELRSIFSRPKEQPAKQPEPNKS